MICVHISRGRGGHREGFVVTGTTATGVGRRGAFMRFSMVAVAVIVRILAYSDLSLNKTPTYGVFAKMGMYLLFAIWSARDHGFGAGRYRRIGQRRQIRIPRIGFS